MPKKTKPKIFFPLFSFLLILLPVRLFCVSCEHIGSAFPIQFMIFSISSVFTQNWNVYCLRAIFPLFELFSHFRYLLLLAETYELLLTEATTEAVFRGFFAVSRETFTLLFRCGTAHTSRSREIYLTRSTVQTSTRTP